LGEILALGVEGTGLYFNARATTLRMTGPFLATGSPPMMDQQLRLTIFLKGGPLEVGGREPSVHPRPVGSRPQGVERTFEPPSQESATILEGFILAHWTGRPAP
jgi:hypothetical protein